MLPEASTLSSPSEFFRPDLCKGLLEEEFWYRIITWIERESVHSDQEVWSFTSIMKAPKLCLIWARILSGWDLRSQRKVLEWGGETCSQLIDGGTWQILTNLADFSHKFRYPSNSFGERRSCIRARCSVHLFPYGIAITELFPKQVLT